MADLTNHEFDLLVIGGGITGAGVALDAAARGLRVALVERNDFASGTSSRSSKLIHGGLRYLEQREFRLVAEGLAERRHLLHNAPHLVRPLQFLLPMFEGQTLVSDGLLAHAPAEATRKAFRTALTLYDLFGGWRLGRHQQLDTAQVRDAAPVLKPEHLRGGFTYFDASCDDARLTLAVLRTAVLDHHAVAANYCQALQVLRDKDGIANGAVIGDLRSGSNAKTFEVRASVVINATGVWAQSALPNGEELAFGLRRAKGVHFAVRRAALPVETAIVLTVALDGRHIFVIPWQNHTYVGTTDTNYDGDLDTPDVEPGDIEYLLNAVNHSVTKPLTHDDITGTWSGVRPLIDEQGSKKSADLSRRHVLQTNSDGMVTITGGKLTAYRRMGADAVDAALEVLRERHRLARPSDRIAVGSRRTTKRLRLRGAVGIANLHGPRTARALGLDNATLDHLVSRYGGEARVLLAMIDHDHELATPIISGLAYLRAEVVYACRYEMAQTIRDVVERRTRALHFEAKATIDAADAVARLMAAEFGWSEEQLVHEVNEFRVSQAAFSH